MKKFFRYYFIMKLSTNSWVTVFDVIAESENSSKLEDVGILFLRQAYDYEIWYK